MLFRPIADVAEELALPQYVLRFWEKTFRELRPVRRARRRYYRPEDIDLLRGIRALRHDHGMTLEGVRRVLCERGLNFVRSVGCGEEIGDTLSPSSPDFALSDLSPDQRNALTLALSDPQACRALADMCLAQSGQLSVAHV